MKRSIMLSSSTGSSSNPSGISLGESSSSTSLKDPFSPLMRLLFSKISSCCTAPFAIVRISFLLDRSPKESFWRVLARLLANGLDDVDSRRVKDWDVWGPAGLLEVGETVMLNGSHQTSSHPSPITKSTLLGYTAALAFPKRLEHYRQFEKDQLTVHTRLPESSTKPRSIVVPAGLASAS